MKRKRNLRWFIDKVSISIRYPNIIAVRLFYDLRRFICDCLYPLGLYNYRDRLFFLAGMAMGGSTWTKNLMSRIPGVFSKGIPMPEDIAYRGDIADSAFRYTKMGGNVLFKTHLCAKKENIDCLMRNGVKSVVVVYRDLRDVALSRYYRLIDFPKTKDAPDYIDYNKMSKEEALDHSIEIVAQSFIPWIKGWFELDKKNVLRIHFLRFEDLKRDTIGTFKKILDFYDILLSDEQIEKIVQLSTGKRNIKHNWMAAEILPEGYGSNFRSGRTGKWREDFSEAHIEKCKRVLGQTLVELGYEKDMNW